MKNLDQREVMGNQANRIEKVVAENIQKMFGPVLAHTRRSRTQTKAFSSPDISLNKMRGAYST